jgi:sialidase-1
MTRSITLAILLSVLAFTAHGVETENWKQIYKEDLSAPDVINRWVVLSGRWETTAEGLRKVGPDQDGIILFTQPVVKEAVKIEYEVKADNKPADLSLFFGLQAGSLDQAAFFGFGSKGNTRNTIRVPDSKDASAQEPVVKAGQWHTVTVIREAGRLKLLIDGKLSVETEDTPQGFAGPYIGFYTWNESVFRSLTVYTRSDKTLEQFLTPAAAGREHSTVPPRGRNDEDYGGITVRAFDPLSFSAAKNAHIGRLQSAVRAAGRTTAMRLPSEHIVAHKPKDRMIGWPTIARKPDGELLVVFSGDREEHMCPYGKVQMVRSSDGGRSWSPVETLVDTPIDDRDSGIVVLPSGNLLVNWFTGLGMGLGGIDWQLKHGHKYAKPMLLGWRRWVEAVTDDARSYVGFWNVLSEDNGKTWSERRTMPASAPHGPVLLPDGTLFYIGTADRSRAGEILAAVSRDEGATWETVWTFDSKNLPGRLCEPHAAALPDGRIVALFRYERTPGGAQTIPNFHHLWQCSSEDGGKTWTQPHALPIWGFPPHLLVLRDGRLLCTYGYRRDPFGIRACLSNDGGRTWDVEHEIIIRADAAHRDLGYPSTVELDDGTLVTAYYMVDEEGYFQSVRGGSAPCLMVTRWTPPPAN